MCEILTLKYNTKGLYFPETSIKEALSSNDNGCGFMLMEKEGNRWEVKDMDTYDCFDYNKEEPTSDDIDEFTIIDYSIDTKDKVINLELFSGPVMSMDFQGGIHAGSHKKDIEFEIEQYCAEYGFEIDLNKKRAYTSRRAYNFSKGSVNYLNSKKAVEKLFNKQKMLKPNQMLIMHFRNATSGFTQSNTQPILNGNFVTIHNGVFDGELIHDNDDKSDTKAFTELLNNLYKKAREVKEVQEEEIINKLLKQVEGWFSIFIYSWETGQLYYRKEGAQFNEAYEGIMMSTKEIRFPVVSKEFCSTNF